MITIIVTREGGPLAPWDQPFHFIISLRKINTQPETLACNSCVLASWLRGWQSKEGSIGDDFDDDRNEESKNDDNEDDLHWHGRCGQLAVLWLLPPSGTLGAKLEAETVKHLENKDDDSTILFDEDLRWRWSWLLKCKYVHYDFFKEGILGGKSGLGGDDEAAIHGWLY